MKDRSKLIDSQRVHDRLVDLIRLPSITGDEEAVVRRIADWLSAGGAELDYWYDSIAKLVIDPAYPGHEVERAWLPVVAGIIRGARPGPTVLFTGHIDVVPPGDYNQWRLDPFSGTRDGDRIYGRGAADMKGGIVAALEAFETFASGPRDFPGRVAFVAVPAEEDSGLGTLAAIRRGWKADAAIIPEPTCRGGQPELVVAHAGAMSCVIEVPGLSAHASDRLSGENALDHYLTIHQLLRQAELKLNESEQHPLMCDLALPYATNMGVIQGGSWSSSVMDHLEVQLRVGVALNETIPEAQARFEQTLHESIQGNEWLRAHPPVLHWKALGFGSAQTSIKHPLVDCLCDAAESVFNESPKIVAAPYGCDMSAWIRLAETPTVLYGPGDLEQAHAANEWVSLSTTEQVARALVRAASALLEVDPKSLRL